MTAALREKLRKTLDNLTEADFKRFKHLLRDQGQITWGELEKADINDTVDLMVQVYSTGAGDVMLTILKKMQLNQLAMDLKRDLERCQLQDAYETLCKVTKTGGVPPPGQIQFPSVQPDSVTLRWSPPEGAPGPHSYRVTRRRGQEQHSIVVAGSEEEVTGRLPGEKKHQRSVLTGHGFFKKHKGELELRLGILAPLLIDLERNKAITALEREEVESNSTTQKKNYTLIRMLERKGTKAQDMFYEALKVHDPLLVEDIEQSAM